MYNNKLVLLLSEFRSDVSLSEFIFVKISLILYFLTTENYHIKYIIILIYDNKWRIGVLEIFCLDVSERFRLSLLQSVNLWIIRYGNGGTMVLAGIAIGVGNVQITPSLINIAIINVSETIYTLVLYIH